MPDIEPEGCSSTEQSTSISPSEEIDYSKKEGETDRFEKRLSGVVPEGPLKVAIAVHSTRGRGAPQQVGDTPKFGRSFLGYIDAEFCSRE